MKPPSLKWFTYHLCAIAFIASSVQAQTVDDYASITAPADLGQYLKSKTQFDGITPEEYVTYLTLTSNQFVQLPLLTTGKVNTNLSFTIAFWFKLTQKLEGESKFLFGLPGSVQCYLTSIPSLICDTAERIKLEISSSNITAGKWLHLVLGVNSSGNAYLMIHDNLKIIGVDNIEQGFQLTQTVASGWSICFSNCNAYAGFNGGIREVIAKSTFMTAETAFSSSHLVWAYANDFKCYFRFNNAVQDYEAFIKDEFVDRTWTQFFDESLNQTASDNVGSNLTIASLIGRDYIPNDICPISYDYDDFVIFNAETTLQTVSLDTLMKQTKYSYTVSMTILVNDTSCTTFDPLSVDSSGCHFVHLDSVFALYFEQSNMARIRFYALKNYYETTSKAFFIPFDQWVTIQFTLDQYAGYSIYVLDLNGKPIVKQNLKTNLQVQRPKPNLTLFRSMIGSVADFRLCDSLFTIPIDESLMTGCLIQFEANSVNVNGLSIPNSGSLGGSLNLNSDPTFLHVPYDDTYYGENASYGVPNSDNGSKFDGIACYDGQATIQLIDKNSHFRFNTPNMQDWMSENTVEFWIKPVVSNATTYFNGTKTIFQMVNSVTNEAFFQIYIQDGNLVCAPFGVNQNITGVFDPTVSTESFTFNNTDQWGWWHISCGYQFQNKIQMTLHNDLIDSVAEKSLEGTTFFVPKESFKASFVHPYTNATGWGLGTLLIKEVRFWAQFRDSLEIKNWRRSQIDPSNLSADILLNYFRLGADNLEPWNFAEVQPSYNFTETNPELEGANLVSDVIYTNEYIWSNDISLFELEQISNYHTVCPLYTYLNENFCYGQPLNKVKLTVIPVFNNDTLTWVFSTLYSSSINQDLIPTLTNEWTAENNLLNYTLQLKEKETGEREISPEILKQENDYKVTVAIQNDAITFREEDSIDFVPNQCQWFEVDGSDAQNGSAVFNTATGYPEVKFNLVLKSSKHTGCDQLNFYDQFQGLDFDYIIFNDIQYMELLPEMKFEVTGSKATNNFTVSVTLPKEEQWKFPIHTDVKIIINVKWTSSKFADLVDTSNLVFQNVIYTIRFNSAASQLIPKLRAVSDLLYQDDTLILDASGTFVTGLSNLKSRQQIQYSWVCPDAIKSLCINKTSSILNITYADFALANQTKLFGAPLSFSVVILWVDGSLYPPSETLNHTIEWLNVPKIQFTIESSPSTILLTSQLKTLFTISQSSIGDSQYKNYNIDWTITPPLDFAAAQNTSNSGQNLVVEAGNWAEHTDYQVSVSVSPKIKPDLVTNKNFNFTTTSPPKDGIVSVSPKAAFINTPITVSIESWTSENGDIQWNVYQSLDQWGTVQGPLLNELSLSQNQTWTYQASKSPVIVQITDPSGESVYFTKKVDIIPPKITPPVIVDNTTVLPVFNQTVTKPPVANITTVTTPPVVNTTVTNPPVANITTVTNPPDVNTTVTNPPVANITTVTNPPVVNTTVTSPPVANITTVTTPTVVNATVTNPPEANITTITTPPVVNTTVTSPPVANITTITTPPVVNTTVTSPPVANITTVTTPTVVNATVTNPPVANITTITTPPVVNTTVMSPPVANITTVTTPTAVNATVTNPPVVNTTNPVPKPVDSSTLTPPPVYPIVSVPPIRIEPPIDTAPYPKTIDITLPSGRTVDVTVEPATNVDQQTVSITVDPAATKALGA